MPCPLDQVSREPHTPRYPHIKHLHSLAEYGLHNITPRGALGLDADHRPHPTDRPWSTRRDMHCRVSNLPQSEMLDMADHRLDGATALDNSPCSEHTVTTDRLVAPTIQASTMRSHVHTCTRRHRPSMRVPLMLSGPIHAGMETDMPTPRSRWYNYWSESCYQVLEDRIQIHSAASQEIQWVSGDTHRPRACSTSLTIQP